MFIFSCIEIFMPSSIKAFKYLFIQMCVNICISEIARLWDVLNDHVEDKRIELISTISLQQFKNSIQYCVVSHFIKLYLL